MAFEMNPEDKARIEEDNKKAREYQEKLAMMIGSTFRTEAGRKTLKHLSVVCNAHGSTVKNKTNPDPNSVLFEEGKRMVYEYILIYIRADNERRKRTVG